MMDVLLTRDTSCLPIRDCAGDLFVPFIFLVFNAGDFLGRLAAGLEPWRSKAPPMAFLIAYSAARALLVGGLVLCNVVTAAPWQLPVLLK